MAIHNLYKPIGISPLDLIDQYNAKNPKLSDQKMTYAGRLDPMAEGVVLILSGEDRHKKDEYLKLDKKYRAQMLFGIESDTYDVLGMPSKSMHANVLPLPKGELDGVADYLIGTHPIKVPPYSSVIVNRKPLFEWARSGQIDQVDIPEREMTVKSAALIESKTINSADLLKLIESKIQKVKGDFRQEQILKSWRKKLRGQTQIFKVLTIDLHVTSGTYIRSLAHELGQKLGSGAILLGLTRTAVGEYTIDNSTKL